MIKTTDIYNVRSAIEDCIKGYEYMHEHSTSRVDPSEMLTVEAVQGSNEGHLIVINVIDDDGKAEPLITIKYLDRRAFVHAVGLITDILL